MQITDGGLAHYVKTYADKIKCSMKSAPGAKLLDVYWNYGGHESRAYAPKVAELLSSETIHVTYDPSTWCLRVQILDGKSSDKSDKSGLQDLVEKYTAAIRSFRRQYPTHKNYIMSCERLGPEVAKSLSSGDLRVTYYPHSPRLVVKILDGNLSDDSSDDSSDESSEDTEDSEKSSLESQVETYTARIKEFLSSYPNRTCFEMNYDYDAHLAPKVAKLLSSAVREVSYNRYNSSLIVNILDQPADKPADKPADTPADKSDESSEDTSDYEQSRLESQVEMYSARIKEFLSSYPTTTCYEMDCDYLTISGHEIAKLLSSKSCRVTYNPRNYKLEINILDTSDDKVDDEPADKSEDKKSRLESDVEMYTARIKECLSSYPNLTCFEMGCDYVDRDCEYLGPEVAKLLSSKAWRVSYNPHTSRLQVNILDNPADKPAHKPEKTIAVDKSADKPEKTIAAVLDELDTSMTGIVAEIQELTACHVADLKTAKLRAWDANICNQSLLYERMCDEQIVLRRLKEEYQTFQKCRSILRLLSIEPDTSLRVELAGYMVENHIQIILDRLQSLHYVGSVHYNTRMDMHYLEIRK